MEVDVIVIGTGFGASVAVTKLLEKVPHTTIHMLERGLWWFTPERPQPLYRYNLFKDIDIVTASGVGGGSLIYANVSIEPRKDGAGNYPVMADWPLKLKPEDYNSPNPQQKQGAVDWMTKYRGKAHQVVTRFPLPAELNLDPKALDANHEHLYLCKMRELSDASYVAGTD